MKKFLIPFAVLILNFSLLLKAQQSIINIENLQASNFPQFETLINSFDLNNEFSAVRIASLVPLEQTVDANGVFHIALDGNSETWVPSIIEAVNGYNGYGGYFDGQTGRIILLEKDGKVSGSLTMNNKSYDFISLENNYFILAENSEIDILSSCPMIDGPPPLSTNCFGEGLNYCQGVVRILYLANQKALDYLDNRGLTLQEYTARQQILQNEFLYNSGIQNKTVEAVYDNAPFIFPDPISATAPNAAGLLALNTVAQDLRSEYKADMVVLYIEELFGSADGVAADYTVEADEAFSVVEIEHDRNLEITVAHELGHLYGVRHQTSSSFFCHRGYDTFSPTSSTEKKVTAVYTGIGQRKENAVYFSNPFVEFQGLPAGVIDERFGAETVADRMCIVSGFEESLDFGVSIVATPDGEDPECPEGYNLQSDVLAPGPSNPGIPPYSYEWRYSEYPFFSSTHPGMEFNQNSSAYFLKPPGLIRDHRYIQLKVTGDDEFSLTRVVRLNFCLAEIDHPSGRLKADNKSKLNVYPNPASSKNGDKIYCEIPTGTHILVLYGMDGKIVFSKEVDTDTQQSLVSLDNNMPVGLYYLCAINAKNEHLDAQRIIIQ